MARFSWAVAWFLDFNLLNTVLSSHLVKEFMKVFALCCGRGLGDAS